MAKKEESRKERLRIRVKAYDARLIESSMRQIVDAVRRHGGEMVGPIPLPTENKKYTVNKSTFVHKKARDQFEIRVHKRLLDIFNPQQKIIEALTDLSLPAGVDVEIKMS